MTLISENSFLKASPVQNEKLRQNIYKCFLRRSLQQIVLVHEMCVAERRVPEAEGNSADHNSDRAPPAPRPSRTHTLPLAHAAIAAVLRLVPVTLAAAN